ncbi:MAG TPA: metallophosphoesterase [Thermomicrobiales bacterium]
MAVSTQSLRRARLTTDRTDDAPRPVNILAISDHVDNLVYSQNIRDRFKDVDLVISCGDLPPNYLEYIVSSLNVPVMGVRGNHDHGRAFDAVPRGSLGPGTIDLHGQVIESNGLLIAGLEGSLDYNRGPHQYSERGMRLQIARLLPQLLLNKLRYGRYLDILVTHAPPRGIHDQPDRCHQGFATLRDFMERFQPRYLLHGHIHLYDRQTITRTEFGNTTVLNAYGYRELRVPVLAEAAEAVAVVSK